MMFALVSSCFTLQETAEERGLKSKKAQCAEMRYDFYALYKSCSGLDFAMLPGPTLEDKFFKACDQVSRCKDPDTCQECESSLQDLCSINDYVCPKGESK